MQEEAKLFGALFGIGCAAAIGKALASAEAVPMRVMLGRAIVGGIGAGSAGAFLAIIPGVPTVALFGIACFIGQAGTEVVMKLVGDYLSKRSSGP